MCAFVARLLLGGRLERSLGSGPSFSVLALFADLMRTGGIWKQRNVPAPQEARGRPRRHHLMATETLQTDSRRGFGRGSAVRDYWLERCQGFRVIRADGRSLGRVRRVETKATGTFLRLTGFRFREFPLSAVETVWPAASVLLVAQSETHQRSVSGPRDATRPSWEDETLPWWELLEGDRSSVEDRGWLPPLAVPQRTWLRWQHGFISGGLRSASSINSLARKLLTRMRARCKHLYILVHRQAHNGWRETRATACRMRCWCAAARAAGGNTIARGRVALARLMLRLAVSLAGGRKALFGTMRPLDTGAHDQSGPGDQPEPVPSPFHE
jgi:hypothetical protein